jgi:hypothetical protein
MQKARELLAHLAFLTTNRMSVMADKIILPQNTKTIPLSKGKYTSTINRFTIVDSTDYDWLNQWRWSYSNGYAIRSKRIGKRTDNKQIYFLMHRQILNAPIGKEVDHINGNKLDNRRCNLRLCSHKENLRNHQRKKIGCSSIYKGVCFVKRNKNWRVQIWVDYKAIWIGSFKTEKEAALAYNNAAIKYHKEFARLNEIKP